MLSSLRLSFRVFVKTSPRDVPKDTHPTPAEDTSPEGPRALPKSDSSPTRSRVLPTLFRSNSSQEAARVRYEEAHGHFQALLAELQQDQCWPDEETGVREGLFGKAEALFFQLEDLRQALINPSISQRDKRKLPDRANRVEVELRTLRREVTSASNHQVLVFEQRRIRASARSSASSSTPDSSAEAPQTTSSPDSELPQAELRTSSSSSTSAQLGLVTSLTSDSSAEAPQTTPSPDSELPCEGPDVVATSNDRLSYEGLIARYGPETREKLLEFLDKALKMFSGQSVCLRVTIDAQSQSPSEAVRLAAAPSFVSHAFNPWDYDGDTASVMLDGGYHVEAFGIPAGLSEDIQDHDDTGTVYYSDDE